ncbi:MAG: nucleoside hydrolase [Spirochaetales bacterium]|nr:nucleoside hydrolase [Spirochaetales bacterium]
MAEKIIIDTDPGIDDAMAIFYALESPELEVLGLTTIFGNGFTDVTTANALKLLEIAERTDIPVSRGADHPFKGKFTDPATFVHGDDGQGNINLPAPLGKPVDERASEFIIQKVNEFPGEVTLVPIGPLTNIALALLAEPGLDKKIKRIVLMGGNCFCAGNATPAAEANIVKDPEAADIVFRAACPITVCGLDVTEKVLMKAAVLDSIGEIDNPRAQHLAKILPFYRSFYKTVLGDTDIHVHDSTAITYLLRPELFTVIKRPVVVATCNGVGRGKTFPGRHEFDHMGLWKDRQAVEICINADVPAVIDFEMKRLADSKV